MPPKQKDSRHSRYAYQSRRRDQIPRRAFHLVVLCLIAFAAHLAFAQADAPQPASATAFAFDAATIRVVSPDVRVTMTGLNNTPDGIESESVNLATLIRAGYGGFMEFPADDRVLGLPGWAKTTSYRVQAKMSEVQFAAFRNLSKDDQEKEREEIVQSLLVALPPHRPFRVETCAGYTSWSSQKGGPRLKRSEVNPDGVKDRDGNPIAGSYLRMYGKGKVQAQALTMEKLANFLAQPPVGLGRPVVDRTGLTGKYSFSLDWAPEPGPTPAGISPPPSDSTDPSIFTALEERLGLRLQPSTGVLKLIAVDHAEPPTDN